MAEAIKSLRQRKAENPEQFHFQAAQDAAVERAEEAAARPALSVVLGGAGEPIHRFRNDTDEEIVFYPKSPKLRDLDAIMRRQDVAEESELQVLMSLMTHILWVIVEGAPDQAVPMRRATLEEIEESLECDDVDLMRRLVRTFLGSRLKASAEGNG